MGVDMYEKLKQMGEFFFWVSFPFVLFQALRVRRSAPRFKAPAGPHYGSIVGHGRVRLLAVGDSIIAGVGAATLDRALVGQTAEAVARALGVGVDWKCVGSIGATTDKISHQLVPRLPVEAADFTVLSTGVNDITSLVTLARWRNSLDALLTSLRHHSPDAIIAVAGIPPLGVFPLLPQPLRALFGIRGRSFDRVARSVVAGHGRVVYVSLDFTPGSHSFSSDGFHPSEESYIYFGGAIASALLQELHHNSSGA